MDLSGYGLVLGSKIAVGDTTYYLADADIVRLITCVSGFVLFFVAALIFQKIFAKK